MVSHRRLAVVTGASSGIGAAAAAALAGDGWRVVLVARGAARLQEIADQITADGGDVTVEALDAADGDAVIAMSRRVVAEYGVPEALVNSAGAGSWEFIEDTPPDAARTMMDAPYFAAYNLTHAFMTDLLAAGRGVIIHVGSPASLGTWPGATAYTAARWALRGLHEALRQDLRGTGVHSCHVLFGEVDSAYFDANDVDRGEFPVLARHLPVMTPDECAAVILDVIRRPRPQVLHPPAYRWLFAQYRMFPALGRALIAWGAPRHAPPPPRQGG